MMPCTDCGSHLPSPPPHPPLPPYQCSHKKCVQKLVEAGADIRIHDNEGLTAVRNYFYTRCQIVGGGGEIVICVHVYMCTSVHVYMCTCVHVCMCTCVQVCMCACCACVHVVHMCMCTCVQVCMCTCVQVQCTRVHVYMCACIHVCMFTCVYVYMYTCALG